MCLVTGNPTSCKIRSVVWPVYAKNVSAAEIHHELCPVCRQNVISEGTVGQWHRMFRDG
jgi:hypothetical protein